MAGASPKLEDVVVTARERRGSKMKIPVTITMTSDQRVARQNIKDLNRIGLAVLNVNLSMRSDRYPNAPIRGIAAKVADNQNSKIDSNRSIDRQVDHL